jgi:hypothetical protein
MKWKCVIASAAMAMLFAPSMAQADSIGAVENARAKERQGSYLSPQDRESLRRYGGNDDYGPRYSYGPYWYGGGYYADYYRYQPRYRAYSAYPAYPY